MPVLNKFMLENQVDVAKDGLVICRNLVLIHFLILIDASK